MPAKPKKNGRQNYDWDLISNDYVCNPKMSLRKIAEKYGIPSCTVYKQSKAENWFATKQEYQADNRAKVRAKVSAEKVEELAGLVTASDAAQQAIVKAVTEDPDYFYKHIISENLSEKREVLDILNFKAMKDMMRVIKDVEDVKRSILDIKRSEAAERLAIERERLELEKERIALERERNALRSQNMSDESNYGVVLIPGVLTDE